jgi:hypothetical protein
MTRGKTLAAILGIAGVGMLALGAGATPAAAQGYYYPTCAAGYYYANGYCYPYQPAPHPVTYYPDYYYAPPPVVVGPSFGINFGFGGGFHHDRDFHRHFRHDFHGEHHR